MDGNQNQLRIDLHLSDNVRKLEMFRSQKPSAETVADQATLDADLTNFVLDPTCAVPIFPRAWKAFNQTFICLIHLPSYRIPRPFGRENLSP
jgi:hypothetical protein